MYETLTGRDDVELLTRVVAMTSAAPGEFATVANGMGSAGYDGGLFATHPILTGIGQTQDKRNLKGVIPILRVK